MQISNQSVGHVVVAQANEHKRAILLLVPACFVIILPLFVMTIMSVTTGHNYFIAGEQIMLRQYPSVAAPFAALLVLPMFRTFMLMILREFAELVNPVRFWQTYNSRKKFYLWRMSESEGMVWIGYFSASTMFAGISLALQMCRV